MRKMKGPKVLAAVCVAGPALVSLIPMAAAPAMPAMAVRFSGGGGGQLFAQMVMTVPAVMLIIAAPIAGMIAAHFGRRLTLLVSLMLYVIGGAGVLLVNDSISLIVLRLLLGIAGGGLLTASLALIGEHFEGEARERVLGYATSVSSLVAAGALVFGGALVDRLGWRAPFALYLAGVPLFITAWFVIRPSGKVLRDDLAHESSHIRELVPILPYYLLLVLLAAAMFMPSIQVPFLLEARGIASATIQGSIVAVTSVVAIFSAASYGFLRRWLSVYAILVTDALSMGVGILVIGLAPSAFIIVTGCALVGIGAGMSEPAITSLIFDRTPAWVHALAMGMIVSALNLGIFFNPLLMAPLRLGFGVVGAFLTFGMVLAVVALFIAVRCRGLRGRLGALSSSGQ